MTSPEPEVVTREPYNAQTPWGALSSPTTPAASFYARNNFPVPAISREDWSLSLGGAVARPAVLRFADLAALPPVELEVVLECAGNGRTRMRPLPEGTPWGDRAVGCCTFRGVPFAKAVAACGVEPGAVEFVFRGADAGKAGGRHLSFERSLPMDVALHPDTLLAYEMDGTPLAPGHGAPVRLLVPRWYGIASVKWLVEARAAKEPFRGHFQAERYVYETRPGSPDAVPVREMRVKSLLVEPREDARLPQGQPVTVRGWAWSGLAPIDGVDVSTDGGRTWRPAALGPSRGPYAWRAWTFPWTPSGGGEVVLLSRARDGTGAVQPAEAPWNVHGYGNNGMAPRRVRVEDARTREHASRT
jgi:DMSO/TMAO reductase YedYZ molybdopterin-dependent catalytic subunit